MSFNRRQPIVLHRIFVEKENNNEEIYNNKIKATTTFFAKTLKLRKVEKAETEILKES